MLQAHRVGESVPNAMVNTELAVLSAAVLGGASLTGGIGTVPGVLLGIILLAILQNGLNLLGVSATSSRSSSASPSSSRPRSPCSPRAAAGAIASSTRPPPMADITPPERAGLLRFFRGLPGGHPGLVALLVALLVVFATVVPNFLSRGTLNSFMYQLPLLGLLSLAMVVPLITGGLNLAIIATTNQCALLMVFLMRTLMTPESGGLATFGVIALALVAGLLLCLAIGLVTGVLVAYHRRPSDPRHARHQVVDRRRQHLSHPRHGAVGGTAVDVGGAERDALRGAADLPLADRRRHRRRHHPQAHALRRRLSA